MALANPPIMVNGGDTDDQRVFHPAAAFRRANYARGGDQTGVTGPESLAVVAGETPGPFVNVMPGSGVITYAQGRGPRQDLAYAQAPNQSVDVYNDALAEVEVRPTTSAGGRTDLVVVEMVDPEMEATRDSTDFRTHQFQRLRVIQGVGSSVEYPWQLGSLGRPVLPLARIHIPASTQRITKSMITDVRHMAFPKYQHLPLQTQFPGSRDVSIGPDQTAWMTVASFDYAVPDWATRTHVEMDLGPLYNTDGAVNGSFRVLATGQNNSVPTQFTEFVADKGMWERFSVMTAGTHTVHPTTAGSTARLDLQIRRWTDSSLRGIVHLSRCVAKGSVTYEQAPYFDASAGI